MKHLTTVRACVLTGILTGLGGIAPIHAQTQSLNAPAAENQQSAVSSELINKALAGDEDALTALVSFVRGTGSKNAEQVTQRATALIAQIGREKGAASTDSLLGVIDQIASNAINQVAGSQIVRIGVDSDFVPGRAVVAWDFGPADGTVAPGFERVLPNDERIGGAILMDCAVQQTISC